MALEDSINELNATMQKLIVVLSSGGSDAVNEALGADTAKGTGRGRPSGSKNKVKEDTYFHDPAHNTAYMVEAGKVPPAVEGAVQITADEFAKLKAQYQYRGNASGPADAPAAAPAQAAQSPAAAPAAQQTASPSSTDGAPTFADIHKRIGDLSKIEGGRDKIIGLFQTWGIATFPPLEGKIKDGSLNAKTVLAQVEAQFPPPSPPAPAADPLAGLGL